MRQRLAASGWYMLAGLLTGCVKPDKIITSNSPVTGLWYTVETFHGHGPLDSDYTRIYAHFDRLEKSDRKLVLSGEYLEESDIYWNGVAHPSVHPWSRSPSSAADGWRVR
jgi:hypothetical protein